MRTKILFNLVVIILLIFLVSAIPQIIVNSPSTSPLYTTNLSIELNFSISESNLNSLIYNWDETNFTLYDSSLVLMMNFDNRSSLGENSTYAIDVSKYGNNGNCSGTTCPVINSSGKYDKGIALNGTQYFSVPTSDSLNFTTSCAFTEAAWIYPLLSADGGYHGFLGREGTQRQPSIWVYNKTRLHFGFGNGTAWCSHLPENNVISNDAWNYVSVTYNGSHYSAYINGVLFYNNNSYGATCPKTTSSQMDIGRVDNYFNGSIDEVRIWNRSLSASEIYQQYISNLQKFNSTQWYLYVNQSKNATAGLDYGTYTYQTFVTNTSNNQNQTEQRTISVQESITPSINLDWISPTSNTNVSQNNFFNVIVNVSCINANCGEINVSLDPDNWWNTGWKYRMPVYFNETKNLARTYEHVRVNFTFSENKLKNENHTALVCNNVQVPFEGYALTTTNGWVTLLQGLTELNFNAYENKTCYLYYDDTDTNVEDTSFLQTGWHYACDSNYVHPGTCGTPEDITPSNADYFGNYSVLNNDNLSCNGIVDSFSHNLWCYFKAPSTGSIGLATASDDGSNLYVEGSKIVNNAACQGTTCKSGSSAMTKNKYYSIKVDYDENDGGNTLYVAYSPTTCALSSLIGNYIDTECYGYYGDEWTINISSGSEEIYSKGLISTVSGTSPFYTTKSNPFNVTLNDGESQLITWPVNATGNLNVTYTFFVYANITSNMSINNQTSLLNITIEEASEVPDTNYPLFSNYLDNNGTLNNSGTAWFNVTIENTNGTVILEINNTNITATNVSASVYNASYTFAINGTYSYKWYSWGNGTNNNYNLSETKSYVVNHLDTTYPLFSNYSDNNATLTSSGVAWFNVTIENTNGTVWISINNTNYTATNLTASVFNVSVNLTSEGIYNYTWYTYGNGSTNLLNNSEIRYYTVNATLIIPPDETPAIIPQITSGGGGSYISEQITKMDNLKIRTFISPNKTKITKIKQDKGTGIKEIELTSKNWLSGEIFVVVYNETPNFCSIKYKDEHKVYKVLDFNNTLKDDSIDSGRLKIGIQKDWIYKNNVSEIKFVRCYPQYEEVRSSYNSETDEEGIYDVYINGFSAYAILGTLTLDNISANGEKIWNIETKPYNLDKIFLWVLILIILIGLIILLVKHRIYLKEKIHSKFFDFEFKFRIGK